jgi:hypothetical protein
LYKQTQFDERQNGRNSLFHKDLWQCNRLQPPPKQTQSNPISNQKNAAPPAGRGVISGFAVETGAQIS